MGISNDFMRQLGLSHPIIQAPMAGSADTPELVAAVSQAGAFGFIGAAYLTPEQILAAAVDVRARTSRPFGINLFAPQAPGKFPKDTEIILSRLAPYAEVNLPAPSLPKSAGIPFDEQLAAVLQSGAASFSFTFGKLSESAVRAVQKGGGAKKSVPNVKLKEAAPLCSTAASCSSNGMPADFGSDGAGDLLPRSRGRAWIE